MIHTGNRTSFLNERRGGHSLEERRKKDQTSFQYRKIKIILILRVPCMIYLIL